MLGFRDMGRAKKIWAKVLASEKASGGVQLDTTSSFADVSLDEVEATVSNYSPVGRDVVKQMIASAGWRIVGVYHGPETISYHIGTRKSIDKHGLAIVVTSPKLNGQKVGSYDSNPMGKNNAETTYDHFKRKNLDDYFDVHNGRQGCGVLGFLCSDAQGIADRYKASHPKLIRPGFSQTKTYTDTNTGTECRVFEAYAYYVKDSSDTPDEGTIIRFTEYGILSDPNRQGYIENMSAMFPLPGIERLSSREIEFSVDALSVCESFADHWVSNVYDREQVLRVFEDTLGFQPKVNFNAGVVGAGEAVIESTVAGNDAQEIYESERDIFRSQDQIFLPINNPLSPHGHVHQYLQELGQGVQHMACRVQNLPLFIHRANKYRQVTGEGLSFLNIPRSYYGYLQPRHFAQLESSEFDQMCTALHAAGIVDNGLVVKMSATRSEIEDVLTSTDGFSSMGTVATKALVDGVLRGRYSNMTELLGDRFTEDEYLTIIENKILVDIQG